MENGHLTQPGSEPTIYKINEGGFGLKTNALIHPTHNLKNSFLQRPILNFKLYIPS